MTEAGYEEKIRASLSATFKDDVTTDEVIAMLRNQGETAEEYWNGLREAEKTAAEYQRGTQAKPDKEKDPVAYGQWLKDTQPYEYSPGLAGWSESKK